MCDDVFAGLTYRSDKEIKRYCELNKMHINKYIVPLEAA